MRLKLSCWVIVDQSMTHIRHLHTRPSIRNVANTIFVMTLFCCVGYQASSSTISLLKCIRVLQKTVGKIVVRLLHGKDTMTIKGFLKDTIMVQRPSLVTYQFIVHAAVEKLFFVSLLFTVYYQPNNYPS